MVLNSRLYRIISLALSLICVASLVIDNAVRQNWMTAVLWLVLGIVIVVVGAIKK